MKTLVKNKPIEGALKSLYEYYFSPGGEPQEALDLAEANDMRNDLEVLIANQFYWADRIIQELRAQTRSSALQHQHRHLPNASSSVEDPIDVIARHARTGEYEFITEFSMLVVNATLEKPAYFCDDTQEFYNLAVRGAANITPIDKVPKYLMDYFTYREVCFKCAKALENALLIAMCKADDYMGGLTEAQFAAEAITITHNIPNYEPITIHTNLKAPRITAQDDNDNFHYGF